MNTHSTAHRPVEAEDASRNSTRFPKRILIAEDDSTLRCAMKFILIAAGYSAESAADGEEALAMLAHHDFDLLLTDRHMPRVDGVELVRAIRAQHNPISILMLSGSIVDAKNLPADIRHEVAEALPKPSTIAAILDGVSRALIHQSADTTHRFTAEAYVPSSSMRPPLDAQRGRLSPQAAVVVAVIVAGAGFLTYEWHSAHTPKHGKATANMRPMTMKTASGADRRE